MYSKIYYKGIQNTIKILFILEIKKNNFAVGKIVNNGLC